MLIKPKGLIKNMTPVLVLLPGIILEFLAILVKNMMEALLVPMGIGVQLGSIVICVCLLLVGHCQFLGF